ncbi:hypothetical protein CJF42_14130 [Pseudoalteromonas sp. NBT06-2]|uniref:hypothetical protein n=1 Tax=Pseudoalteromonas sp. NBT06-2 TaxID=2025950 RepID=UPI000BA66489|nr:hypothetical protein [Pseudoalteromonas sp. NBT06-2]PAJ73780.1 hypothetical protein CJF42_14130 [Pseudoalteromonas sp. NBT06-2]
MAISPALNSGVQGFQRATQEISESTRNINRAAQEQQAQQNNQIDRERAIEAARDDEVVAQPAQPPAKINEELVNLKVEQFNAQANVSTIQTADEVLGTLIDVRV